MYFECISRSTSRILEWLDRSTPRDTQGHPVSEVRLKLVQLDQADVFCHDLGSQDLDFSEVSVVSVDSTHTLIIVDHRPDQYPQAGGPASEIHDQ